MDLTTPSPTPARMPRRFGGGLMGSLSRFLMGSADEDRRSSASFALPSGASGKPGQIVQSDRGSLVYAPNIPAPWNGNYETFENGGSCMTSQGANHEYFNSLAGAGAQRTTLQSEPDWFQNPCAIETGTTTTGSFGINTAGANAMFAGASTGTLFAVCSFGIESLSDVTNRFAIGCGFQDTSGAFSINNGATLRYRDDNNGGRFEFCTAAGGVRSTIDTGITPVVGSYYKVRVEIVNNTIAKLYIKVLWDASSGSPAYADDGVWGSPIVTLSTNIPSGTGQGVTAGVWILKSAGTTSRRLKVGVMRAGREPTFGGNPLVLGPDGTCVGILPDGSPGFIRPHRIGESINFFAYDRGGFTPSGTGVDFGSDAGGGGTQTLARTTDNGMLGATGLFSGSSATGWSFRRTAYNLNLGSNCKPHVYETHFKVVTLSTGTQTHLVVAGLVDSVSTAHSNGITIELDSNSNTHFLAKCTSGGVATTVDTGLTAVAGTTYFVRIIYNGAANRADFYLAADGTGGMSATKASITTNVPTGSKNLAQALGIRKSVGTTSIELQYNFIFGYQRSTTFTSGGSNAMGLSIGPAPGGMSNSTLGGQLMPDERAVMLDDNTNVAGAAPVLTFAPWSPRTHSWSMNQTGHTNWYGSSDLNARGSELGSDLSNPNRWTFGASTSIGHVACGNAGGVATIVLSGTSGRRICDFQFQVPVLSTGSNQHNLRFGFANLTFGTAGSPPLPAHGVYAELDSSVSANVQIVARQASTETRTDTGVAITAATDYRGRIEMDLNSTIRIYLGPASSPLPSTPAATITTNIPSGTSQSMCLNFVIELLVGTTAVDIPVGWCLHATDRYAA